MELTFTAPEVVREIVAKLGRTEDVRFSPSGRRLAVAAFASNRIAVFDVSIAAGRGPVLERAFEIASPALHEPHGVDFLDEDRIVAANRNGAAPVFALPAADDVPRVHDLAPLFCIPADPTTGLHTPGSVAAVQTGPQEHELLFCNNYAHTVTRHRIGADGTLRSSEVLLRKWLDIPDGVSVSADRSWIAISNHNTRTVLLYANTPALNPDADPDGLLRGAHFPHGIRFSRDGRHLFVADAAEPYVHVFAAADANWRGVRQPVASFRVMDDATHLLGHYNSEEGGPKGLDVDPDGQVLVVTSVHQPLAFFDVPTMRQQSAADQAALAMRYELRLFDHHRHLQAEATHAAHRALAAETRTRESEASAHLSATRAGQSEAHLAVVLNSLSWRLTAPLRRLHAAICRTKR
jgi:6-phosphogluconolactonase (cycloisomerase 2 family)